MRKITIIILAVLLTLLPACTPREQQSISATPTAQIATSEGGTGSSTTKESTTGLEQTPAVSPITLDQPYAKVLFHEGPFEFEFYLIQDLGYSKNPAAAWMYSDMPGVGIHASWRYAGTSLNEQVTESWGTCPDVNPGTIYPTLADGDHGIREGGILLPESAGPDSPVQFVFKIEVSQRSYGGILSIVPIQGTQGLEPAEVTIYGFDQSPETSVCNAEFLSASGIEPTITSTLPTPTLSIGQPPFIVDFTPYLSPGATSTLWEKIIDQSLISDLAQETYRGYFSFKGYEDRMVYSFRYPTGWYVDPKPSPIQTFVQNIPVAQGPSRSDFIKFEAVWLTDAPVIEAEHALDPNDLMTVEMAGRPAILYSVTQTIGQIRQIMVICPHEEGWLVATGYINLIVSNPAQLDSYSAIIYNILSSFTFANQPSGLHFLAQ